MSWRIKTNKFQFYKIQLVFEFDQSEFVQSLKSVKDSLYKGYWQALRKIINTIWNAYFHVAIIISFRTRWRNDINLLLLCSILSSTTITNNHEHICIGINCVNTTFIHFVHGNHCWVSYSYRYELIQTLNLIIYVDTLNSFRSG